VFCRNITLGLTDWLIAIDWLWILFEKLIVAQLVTIFPVFMELERPVPHLENPPLDRNLYQCSLYCYVTSTLVLHSYLCLGLQSSILNWGLLTKILYAFIFPMHATCPSHHILLHSVSLITLGKEYKLLGSFHFVISSGNFIMKYMV
jgi:hypothetical protein